ncbi:CRE-FPN-1.3 protein [Caenorhabditis remanei]|uniref:Solute carrier family 40 member n=1 Tax=Caenorhabditis remanei TaxID=31234 RepID=E3MB82_CAERE|nr:CRE-FPN-1.3 protein [Caenorhabditis remanei]
MISKKYVFLYAAFTLTCVEDRAWSFFVTIVLESIGGMYFVSIGQFSESFLQMMFGGMLGQFIDWVSRKNAIIMVTHFNNFSILMASFILLKGSPPGPLLYLSIFLCAINRLFLNAEKSIISRDWIVALNHESALARQNATLTGFDQLLNVLSPVVVGTLITSFGIHQTLIIFAIGSMVSLILKSTFFYFTYTSNPCLQTRRNQKYYKIVSGSDSDLPLLEESGQNLKPPGVFSTYYRQTTFCASLGMALFYKTVMGFDNLAVGYATTSSNLSIFTIGALKSYGAVAGMAGVISYAFLETKFGLIRAGYVGLVVQQVFSLLAATTIWMPGSPFLGRDIISDGPSISVFLVAIASSRFGLWCLDMAVTHSMQLHVPESEINTVFGFHMALCQTFSVPKEMLVIVFPEPSHFALYILSSYFCVTLGQYFFYLYARKVKE